MLRAALGDPAFGTQTPSLVSAFSNYCGRNPDPNVVQEIGERLLARDGVAEEDRRQVRGLMERFTPAAARPGQGEPGPKKE